MLTAFVFSVEYAKFQYTASPDSLSGIIRMLTYTFTKVSNQSYILEFQYTIICMLTYTMERVPDNQYESVSVYDYLYAHLYDYSQIRVDRQTVSVHDYLYAHLYQLDIIKDESSKFQYTIICMLT